jgi:hypothetical protein
MTINLDRFSAQAYLVYGNINSMEFPQKYTVSREEIDRRKKAFNSFILALFFSVSLTLRFLLELPFSLFLLSNALFACILLIGWVLMQKAFDAFAQIEVNLLDEILERKTFASAEKIFGRDISAISIKKTVHKKIREIKISFRKNRFYLNGLENMEDLFRALKKMVSPGAKISERKEPIDFDSSYFYPILGVILGSGGVWLLSLLVHSFDQSYFRMMKISLMVLALALAIYFVFTKPLSKSHGKRFRRVDRAIGILFFILWLGLLYLTFYSSADI